MIGTSGDVGADASTALIAQAWRTDAPLSTSDATSYRQLSVTAGEVQTRALEAYVEVGATQAAATGATPGTVVRVDVVQSDAGSRPVLDEVRGQLITGVALALVIIGAATWLAVSLALRPVERIRRDAARLTAASRDARLTVPGTHDEIADLARTFNELLARRGELDAAQRRFLDDAAHELRTPIASLLTTLEVASGYPDALDHAGAVQTALLHTRRLHRLAADLLALAAIDSGSHRFTSVDLADAAISAIEALGHRDADGPTIEIEMATGLIVDGDRAALERLVTNLVVNAVRFAETSIRVVGGRDGADLVVDVSNDGESISPEDRERIFGRFTRLDAARDTPGSGLGLAIARDIATAHGGTLVVLDAPRTTFRLRLPGALGASSA
ncbi:hypothetical protein ASG00_12715 [Microbacterium sp. Leaf351]|nr:hypothetical protein ASG00_12715 [Microbacterium sp. Leaf351]